MNKISKQIKYFFIIIFLLALSIQMISILRPQINLSLLKKIILIFIQIFSIIGWTYFDLIHVHQNVKQKKIYKAHCFVFIIYIANLIYILFFDHDFGRYAFSHTPSLQEYWNRNVNLYPFHTIQLFVRGYQNGIVSLETLLRNLLGNFIVFMPMGYFLPFFFKNLKKWRYFCFVIVFIVLLVECLQVIFRLGSGDIDDLFLNVMGALLIYGFIKCFDRKEK